MGCCATGESPLTLGLTPALITMQGWLVGDRALI